MGGGGDDGVGAPPCEAHVCHVDNPQGGSGGGELHVLAEHRDGDTAPLPMAAIRDAYCQEGKPVLEVRYRW